MAPRKPPAPKPKPKRRHRATGKAVGRPSHVPTADIRGQVEAMAGLGIPVKMMAAILKVGEATIHKHYADELDLGEAKATVKVATTLFNRATKGGDLGAAIFWLKVRAGWRDRSAVDVGGKVEVGVSGEVKVAHDAASAGALAAIAEIERSLAGGGSEAAGLAEGGTS